jgi:hypothetical protein
VRGKAIARGLEADYSYVLVSTIRTLVAFVMAPLMTPLVFMAFAALADRPPGVNELWVYLAYFGVWTYPSVVIFGIPAFFLYRRYGLRSIISYAIGGAGIGFATALVWLSVLNANLNGPFYLFVAECIVAGAASAVLFRGIAHAGT